MSITLPIVNLTGLVAGNTGKVTLANLGMTNNPSLVNKPATLRFHNDSGTGLLISFKVTSGAFYLPAGGWADVQIDSGESEIDYQVTYVLTGAQLTLLQITYYAPSETVPAMTNLGNSPIGISGNVTVSTAQSLDNEGNIASTQWLKVIQSGGPASNFAATVDGNFQIEQWDGTTLKNLFHTIPNAGAGNSSLDLLVAGLFGRILGKLAMSNNNALQGIDNAGTPRDILRVDGSNNTIIQTVTGNDQLLLQNAAGTIQAIMDLVLGILTIPGTTQSATGDGGGTMTVNEVLAGPVKLVVLTQNAYKQAGAAQLIALKKSFTFMAGILNFGAGGIVQATGSTVNNNNQVTWGTGTSGGTSASNTQIPGDAAGFSFGTFDHVGSSGGYAGAHTGIGIYVGQ